MHSSKHHRIDDKTPSTRSENISCWVVFWGNSNNPKTIQAIALAFGCLLECKGIFLLQNTLHDFRFRIWTHQAESDPEASHLSISFHRTVSCHARCQEKETILPICDAYDPQQWSAWQDMMMKGAIVALVSWWSPN